MLYNFGQLPLSLSSLRLTDGGQGFSIGPGVQVGDFILPGEFATITVLFDPGRSGQLSDVLEIGSNANTDPLYSIALTGSAISSRGQITLSLGQNNLGGALPLDVAQVSGAATIHNTGAGPLTIYGFRVVELTQQFAVSSASGIPRLSAPIVLAAGESLDLDASYTPSGVGLERGIVEIVTDDPDAPVTRLTLVGTGLPGAGDPRTLSHAYVVVTTYGDQGTQTQRLVTNADGSWHVNLAKDSAVRAVIFNPANGLVAEDIAVGDFLDSGLFLGTFMASTSPDSDGDGLPDDVEFVLGTLPTQSDSNADGIDDLAALRLGLDPTTGLALDASPAGAPTQIVATVGGGVTGSAIFAGEGTITTSAAPTTNAPPSDGPETAGAASVTSYGAVEPGWHVRGSGTVAGNLVTLTEEPGLLPQAAYTFAVPATTTILQFTVRAALGLNPAGVADAFEAALLDATTGESLVSLVSLTQTDAFLNLQASGRLFLGGQSSVAGVTAGDMIDPAAAFTVVVDLSGLTPDTLATLYFDLLGFGAVDAEVTIEAIEFLAPEPLTVDAGDAQNVDEGTTVQLHGVINDSIAGDVPAIAWHVTSDNGQVIADGDSADFSFVPTDNGAYLATLTVTDGTGHSVSDTVSIVVADVRPTASANGPATATYGEAILLSFGAEDDSVVDRQAGFSYLVHWGDGSPDTIVPRMTDNGTGLTTSHRFASAESFVVEVTATDKDGMASSPYIYNIDVAKAHLRVTADEQLQNAGDPTPNLTAMITGFVNDETLATSGVTGAPNLSTADPASGPGQYPIHVAVGTLAAGNYDFPVDQLIDGLLTINARPVAGDDAATTGENVAVPIDVLSNDSDSDGTVDSTTVMIVGAAGHGTTSVDPASGVVTYTPAANYTGPDSFTYRIKDDRDADSNVATVSINVLPSVTVSIGDVSASEGNLGTTDFVFTISLSAASVQGVTVEFFTSPDTASAGSDYQSTSGTLSFEPGLTVELLTVSVVGDTAVEPDETFYVNLSNAVNATLGANSARGTIRNDDVVTSGLVAAYSFNAGAGSTVIDLSGHGNNGTVVNATWSTAGMYGDALSFNGHSAMVNVPDSASLHLTSGMTLEAWVLPTVVSNAWRDVIYKGNDNYYLEATSYYTKPAGGVIIGSSHVEAFAGSPLARNTWAHLAVTYDGAKLRLYVNGILVSSTAHTGNIETSNNPLQIGGDSIFGQYFAGLIDEVRVYNRALSSSEIVADMNTPLGLPPVADAGGPYAIEEGDSLTLDGSASSNHGQGPLGYSWDLNGDGTFGDATGVTPTLSWNQLKSLGITDGPAAVNNVRVRVDDGQGGVVDSAATTLTVNNAPPTAGISGPAAVLRGESASFTLSATDPSPADQAGPFAFVVDWGDGSPAQTVTDVSGTVVTHTFYTAGPLTVSVTAADRDSDTGLPAASNVQVDAAQLRANAQNPALVDLIWGGTPGDDRIELVETSGTTVRVHETLLDGTTVDLTQVYSGVTGRVLAYGNAGNDRLDARGLATRQATLDGGGGNNTLHGGAAGDVLIGGSDGAEGQQGSNVIIAGNGTNTIYGNAPIGLKGSTGGDNLIVGGSGNDTIFGNFERVETKNGQPSDGGEGGQNLIIDGGGSDTLYASQMADGAEGGHGSILVAGSTTLGESALLSVLSEWTSTRSYAARVANIEGTGSGPRNNGNSFLQAGVTVFDDGSHDDLFSDTKGELDWLLFAVSIDTPHRVKPGEKKTNL